VVLHWGRAAFCEKEGQKVRLNFFREFVLPPYIFPHKPFVSPTPTQNSEYSLKTGTIISGKIKVFSDPDYNTGSYAGEATVCSS
jgi:hypothetical protein